MALNSRLLTELTFCDICDLRAYARQMVASGYALVVCYIETPADQMRERKKADCSEHA